MSGILNEVGCVYYIDDNKVYIWKYLSHLFCGKGQD